MLLDVWKWMGNNVAEIIATCALTFTAYQAYLSRRHNRISVIPKLAAISNRNQIDNIGMFDVILSNNGLGPAVIKSYQIELDGLAQEFKDSEEALSFLKGMVGTIERKTKIMLLLPEHIIAAGESIPILHISFVNENGEGREYIDELMDRFSLRVKYMSIYGDNSEYHSTETHNKKYT